MKPRQVLLLCALAGIGAHPAHAAQTSQASKAAVDADLLEFLGSIGEDDDWQDFLEQKPVKATDSKTAKVAQKSPAKTPEASGPAVTPKEKTK